MRKINFILLLIMFFPHFLLGQETVSIDPKAKSLLDKATSGFDTKKGLVADFVLSIENTRDDRNESIPGKIWLKEDKFKLSIKDIETYFDGKIQSVYMKDAKEVTISEPQQEELEEINPLMLIKSYQKGYKMKFMGSKQEGNKTIEIIDLYPEDLENGYARITIAVEKETMRLYFARTQGKDGINTLLMIKKYDFTPLQDNIFSFNPEQVAGIEIVDLR